MKNITEILKELGVEIPAEKEAELTKAVGENYKTIADYQKQTGKTARAEEERDTLRTQLTAAQDTLKGFEGVDLDTIRTELADWKKKAEDAEKDYAAKLYQRDFEDTLKAELESVKFSSEAAKKAVMSEIREAELKLKDGRILGLGDLIGQIRERDGSAFIDEEEEELEANKARFTDRSKGHKTPEGFEKMSLAEKMAYANSHPNAAEVAAWLKS